MENQIQIQRNEKGQFIKGIMPYNKGKQMISIQKENHYRWKGGTHATAKRILKREKINTNNCRICKEEKKTIIHHIDGNSYNNDLKNLAVICYFCHNAIHGIGVKTRFQTGHDVPMSWRNKISIANKGGLT